MSNFLQIPLENNRQQIAISIGQFRPEKDHLLQITAFRLLLQKYPELAQAKLLLVGSCRGQEDENRVLQLKIKAKELGIERNVEFHVNIRYQELMQLLATAQIGLHSMWNEHFGICVVELMASGVVTIAHNSAGPKLDIITHGEDGLLASSPDEYCEAMAEVFRNFEKFNLLRRNARRKVEKFSQEAFSRDLQSELMKFLI